MRELKVELAAISVDPSEKSKPIVDAFKIPFPILTDADRKVTTAYGLLHTGGGPQKSDIPLPATLIVDPEGRIVWKRVAPAVNERPDPQAVLKEVRERLAKRK